MYKSTSAHLSVYINVSRSIEHITHGVFFLPEIVHKEIAVLIS